MKQVGNQFIPAQCSQLVTGGREVVVYIVPEHIDFTSWPKLQAAVGKPQMQLQLEYRTRGPAVPKSRASMRGTGLIPTRTTRLEFQQSMTQTCSEIPAQGLCSLLGFKLHESMVLTSSQNTESKFKSKSFQIHKRKNEMVEKSTNRALNDAIMRHESLL
eukprot:s2317_g12.t1